MELKAKCLFLYGLEINNNNSSLDFKTTAMGSTLLATLTFGFYSLGDLMNEVVRAMKEVDPLNDFTYSIDRTVNGGLENRITLSTTTGSTLELLFATGPRTASTVATTIGFAVADYTGATSHISVASAGTVLVTEFTGYTYLGPEMFRDIRGTVNISTSGRKEAIVFQIQEFFQVMFKYEPESKVKTEWLDLVDWMIQQRGLEFTPEITSPSTFFNCTLERTDQNGKGLGMKWIEMLPNFPFFYQTGNLVFRIKE